MSFFLTDIAFIKTIDEARQQAKDWQCWVSQQNLSYSELPPFHLHFETLAKKFGLEEEFKENGII